MSENKKETRNVVASDLRVQSGGDGKRLRGKIPYWSVSRDLGGFVEQISDTAFRKSLAEAARGERNIHGLWNHDSGQPLGSTRGGKLKLTNESTGLLFDLSAARLTPAQVDAVADGDVQVSFAFRTISDKWDNNRPKPLRTLLDVDLFEISIVSQPAYEDTTIALRALSGAPRSITAGKSVAELKRELERIKEENDEGIARLNRDINSAIASEANAGSGYNSREWRKLAIAKDPEATAISIHEAGHAVASYLEMKLVTHLRFAWDRDRIVGGRYQGESASSVFGHLAGVAAERLFGLNPTPESWSSDRSKALAKDYSLDLELEIARAQDRLRPFRRAIDALATELRLQTEVSGRRAEEIIRAVNNQTVGIAC